MTSQIGLRAYHYLEEIPVTVKGKMKEKFPGKKPQEKFNQDVPMMTVWDITAENTAKILRPLTNSALKYKSKDKIHG